MLVVEPVMVAGITINDRARIAQRGNMKMINGEWWIPKHIAASRFEHLDEWILRREIRTHGDLVSNTDMLRIALRQPWARIRVC
jgi:hypothetical protein